MAYIGLSQSIVAPLLTEVKGQMPTYASGFFIGEPISVSVSLQRSQVKLQGGDKTVDSDNSVTGGSVTFNTTTIPQSAYPHFGYVEKTVEGSEVVRYVKTGDASQYVGFGFVRTIRNANVLSYEATWIYKMQMDEDAINGSTKGDSVQFQTPNLTGTLLGVETDDSGKVHWYEHTTFQTAAEALAYLKNYAGMSA